MINTFQYERTPIKSRLSEEYLGRFELKVIQWYNYSATIIWKIFKSKKQEKKIILGANRAEEKIIPVKKGFSSCRLVHNSKNTNNMVWPKFSSSPSSNLS